MMGQDHPNTLISMNNLARLYEHQGRYAEAEPLLVKAAGVSRRVLGAAHPNTLRYMNNLSEFYQNQGKYMQAEPVLMEALELERRVLGKEHPTTLTTMGYLADGYEGQGKHNQAEAIYTELLELRRRVLGAQHLDTISVLVSLSRARLQERRYSDAEPLLREALRSYEKAAPSAWTRYNCESMLGASLAGQRKYEEAEARLLSGYEGMRQKEATIPVAKRAELKQAGNWIVQLYQNWGKPRKAAEWRQKLRVPPTPAAAKSAASSIQAPAGHSC
jgi:tetratricopeptide (TPR) repeat protein